MKKDVSFDNKILSRLFDLQRFSQNSHLAKIIRDTESRYGAALSDDDLTFVNAAGDSESVMLSDQGSDGTVEEPR